MKIPVLLSQTVIAAIFLTAVVGADPKPLLWEGLEWQVKASPRLVSPGPNYYSRSSEAVYVDHDGLHMLIRKQKDRWFCSEIISVKEMGYGTYRLSLTAKLEEFPKQAVFGFFTWSENPEFHNREIDIELSAWNQLPEIAGQFIVQPFENPGNTFRFPLNEHSESLVLLFERTSKTIKFRIENADDDKILGSWEYAGSCPPEKDEHLRFNLWLYKGLTDNLVNSTEVVLTGFKFVPLDQKESPE